MKFNVGKFNVKSTSVFSVTGVGDVTIDSAVSRVLVEKYTGKTESGIVIDSNATYYTEVVGLNGTANVEFDSYALASNLTYGSPANADIVFDGHAVGSLLGEDYVEIRGLVLRPGQEVEIDMCNLTVTVNGENAMHLMSTEGDFFDFLIGNNDIDIEAIGAGSVQVDTYWKDRWL